jgi:membrane fusion protein (multidrug efflux system)
MNQSALAKSTPVLESDVASALDPEAMSDLPVTRTPRRNPVRMIIVVLLAVAGLLWAVRYGTHLLTHAETDDAYVTGYVHQVTPHVGGTVSEVLVDENQDVKAGQVLFRLDPRDNEAKLRQAQAQLAQSDALIDFTKAEIANTQAKIDQAQAQFVKAGLDFDREKDLVRTKVASQQEFDNARAAYDTGNASLLAAKASLEAMNSGLLVAQAQRQNSQTALENAQLQLSYDTVAAPSSGRTSKRSVELGAYAQPGQSLIAIVEPQVWIEANFKETQLAKMHDGQRADITIDALPGHAFSGTVESISPASGAQFALLPADNATGNFTKVVQRVPVKIHLDPESVRGFEDRFRPGLSAVVSVLLK